MPPRSNGQDVPRGFPSFPFLFRGDECLSKNGRVDDLPFARFVFGGYTNGTAVDPLLPFGALSSPFPSVLFALTPFNKAFHGFSGFSRVGADNWLIFAIASLLSSSINIITGNK